MKDRYIGDEEGIEEKVAEICEGINKICLGIQTSLYGNIDNNELGGLYGGLINKKCELEKSSKKYSFIKETIGELEKNKKEMREKIVNLECDDTYFSDYVKISLNLNSEERNLKDTGHDLIKCGRKIKNIEHVIDFNKNYITELGNIKKQAINLLVDSKYKL
jgi:hypothetical protein